jgi:hypothetical protein
VWLANRISIAPILSFSMDIGFGESGYNCLMLADDPGLAFLKPAIGKLNHLIN